MKDKNLNILSPRTSNPLLYIIYNWHSSPIVFNWTVNIRNIHCVNIIAIIQRKNLILCLKCDVSKFRISPPPCHTRSHFVDPPPLNV